MSLPRAAAHCPAATAAAEPPEDPPGTCSKLQGLRVACVHRTPGVYLLNRKPACTLQLPSTGLATAANCLEVVQAPFCTYWAAGTLRRFSRTSHASPRGAVARRPLSSHCCPCFSYKWLRLPQACRMLHNPLSSRMARPRVLPCQQGAQLGPDSGDRSCARLRGWSVLGGSCQAPQRRAPCTSQTWRPTDPGSGCA